MKVEDIRTVAIVGAGLMGHGIAQEFALAGYDVRMQDLTEQNIQQAMVSIRANLERLVGLGLISPQQAEVTPGRIRTSTQLDEIASEADLVIEAVFENLEVKQDIFRQLDELCPEHSILASNTSAILPSKLAIVTKRPERVLVVHYWNPPYLMPLVEIVRHPEVSDETVATVYELLLKMGKSPAIVQKEAAGFIGNRLQVALFREAISMVEKGIASPQDIDTVIKNGPGRRWAAAGIFEMVDTGGADLILSVCEYLIPDLENSNEMPPLLEKNVERGDLGIKTGKGFYEWTPEKAEALRHRIAQALVKIAQW